MNELHLFAGAGGGILGSELLGMRTVCAVELESYPASVLLARQNDGLLPPFPVWDDVRTFDGRRWRGLVDVVSGGFPCQDISAAGKGAGIDGTRSGLWKEMHRIINEVRPEFAFLENSPLLVGRGLARVLGDLAEIGYDAEWLVLGADDVGPLMNASACGSLPKLPTLAKVDGEGGGEVNWKPVRKSGHRAQLTLRTAVRMLPTLTCQDAKNNGAASQMERNSPPLNALAGGPLNPTWCEWFMGWPEGWTELKPLATDKYRLWRQLHSLFCLND